MENIMKKILVGLSLLVSVASFASEFQFNKLRNDFRNAKPIITKNLKDLAGHKIMCVTMHEDGSSDIVDNAINIVIYKNSQNTNKIIKNEASDSRWIFEYSQSSDFALGVSSVSTKFQPVPYYFSLRSLNDAIIVEWSHKPYSVKLGYGFADAEYGYYSAKSISMPKLVSRSYSYCKH